MFFFFSGGGGGALSNFLKFNNFLDPFANKYLLSKATHVIRISQPLIWTLALVLGCSYNDFLSAQYALEYFLLIFVIKLFRFYLLLYPTTRSGAFANRSLSKRICV